jgi:sulfide:quinone oxidoreductase
VHLAKVAFEKYYLRKVRKGTTEPYYEKFAMRLMGVEKLKGNV